MLKKILGILAPELVKLMMEMGHGDEIVFADGNFPSEEYGRRVVRLDGYGIPDVLEAVLKFFPLDTYTPQPVVLMEVVPGDEVETPIWDEYKKIIENSEELKGLENCLKHMERFAFYERAKKAFVVVATGEPSLYANIIFKKGIV